ncbi:TPA: DUF3780 domain-containing protein [Bacillus cereus]|uniref:anti-phage-associated DUF3780 domain-containing protein n=1 Tax=Bacillus TaxID=1386 RepID=UPI001F427B68|nr:MULTISPECIES: anti-phage-associated DUF3780 domain-containing protein [Bacillus]MCT1383245.1 DUF3780 domain-containing protein [Bacillus sp. p3-SID196]BCD08911.1 hypothetical protein BC30052_p2193 [Bacillus cereus]HDR8088179.1 DUF3780 domain-containing protein [Bacillus cereus]HDX9523918.1 DUF3780 domain-containing protein [Bacillus cereus]HDX9583643.1 DUF3780 domain-containing protein [Bacillus cereus]
MSMTTDFGAPTEFGMHHFYVEIPAAPRDAVSIYEDFGFDGDEAYRETVECRLVLARELWTKIRDDVRRDFNARLKSKKQSTGSWTTGRVKLDRFLGRELCVLGWAAEHASPDECPVICQKWLALRPEERWWLYSKTASEAGLDSQSERGWRKALYCALSDGTNIKLGLKTKAKTKQKKLEQEEKLSLFDFIEKGDI